MPSRPFRRSNAARLLTTIALTLVLAPMALHAATGSVTVAVPDAQIVTATRDGTPLTLAGFGRTSEPGAPCLPSRIFAIAIPPGATLRDVSFALGTGVDLGTGITIPPVPLAQVISNADPRREAQRRAEYDATHAAIYGSAAPYPASPVEVVRTAGYRQYNLVDVRVTPFSYRPADGHLVYYPDLTITVTYDASLRSSAPMLGSVRAEARARELILNYDQARDFCATPAADSRDSYDYVIITTNTLRTSVDSLVAWETAKGRSVYVITTPIISVSYPGVDLAEKIRNFLREKYPTDQWGIEDVLLVGTYTDVPMRRTAQDLGYGAPQTDFYYAELTASDADSWDSNGNLAYGDNSDTLDFYAEVNVGRIPHSSPTTVTHICDKSVAYEQNSDSAFKRNILLLGAYFWNNDPNPVTDNAKLMEACAAEPWMADWTITRMYERNSDCWSPYPCDFALQNSNVMAQWATGTYAFVNWAGHGSPYSSHIYGLDMPAFISTADCPYLNDDYPAIIFADACSNADTDTNNISRSMLAQGAVGFVGATKVALGCPGWDHPLDGSTQSLDYYFTTSVTSGDMPQGEALYWALSKMYTHGLFSYNRYETFEWAALSGSPTLALRMPATLCPGDANCDGFINFRDIDYFVAAQNDNVAAWEALFGGAPTCDFLNNDANADGFVNFRDIDPFVALQNTTCP